MLRRALSFLNLLEDGQELKLSLTRVGMWAAIFCMVWMCVRSPTSAGSVLAAFATMVSAAMGQIGLILNYIHQRNCERDG